MVKAIKERQKKKGEVQKDENFNGIKNFPILATRQYLENSYIADLVKANQLRAEEFGKDYMKTSPNDLLLGAYSTLLSSVVSKAQSVEAYKLPEAVVYVPARMSQDTFEDVAELTEEMKKAGDKSASEKLELAKKTTMLFPGITRVYLSRESAVKYLLEPTSTGSNYVMVLFEVTIDTSHPNLTPMNLKKFLEEEPLDESKAKNVADGLMQRLMIQI